MKKNMHDVCCAVEQIDMYLRNAFPEEDERRWENSYFVQQQKIRKQCGTFPVSEHIRAMVYAQISSGIAWERRRDAKGNYKNKDRIDHLFREYNPNKLLKCRPEELYEGLREMKCSGQRTERQMRGLIETNIEKMLKLEQQYGSVDAYYSQYIPEDSDMKKLIRRLSTGKDGEKYAEMGEALTAEYLRNIGYDAATPDRLVRRILGSRRFGCSNHIFVPVYETFQIIERIAHMMKKSVSEVSYLLWAFCAKGYGEICQVKHPMCDVCIVSRYCMESEDYEVQ